MARIRYNSFRTPQRAVLDYDNMIKLRYGNTNTFFIPGKDRGLLVDTDWAGTLPRFFKAIGNAGIGINDIGFLLATHYHPDHTGLAGELQALGVTLVIADVQLSSIRFPDGIFSREKIRGYKPADESAAKIVSCKESRSFLASLGISGEIIHTPSHSSDSVSLILDDGCAFVGDLEPASYIGAYDGGALKKDWENVIGLLKKVPPPARIYPSHANEKELYLKDNDK